MKKLNLTVFAVICAICMAFGVMVMTNANTASADPAVVLSATAIKKSTAKDKMLLVTAIKNYETVYEVGYTGISAGDKIIAETDKYYSEISTGTATWDAEDIFGDTYAGAGLIVWEIAYSPANEYTFQAYAKYGAIEGGVLVANEPETVLNGTERTTDVETRTVTFEMGAGTAIAPMDVDYGTPVSALDNISVTPPANQVFVKWQLKTGESTYEDFVGNETLTQNITVKAVYDTVVFTAGAKLGAYQFNETYKFPAATARVGATPYAATVTVTDPDDQVVPQTDAGLQLTKIGTYTLTYSATIGGNEYTSSETIESVAKAPYISGAAQGTTMNYDVAIDGVAASGKFGLTIAAGDEITINEIYDYTGVSYNSNYLFWLHFNAMTQENYVGKNFTVTLRNVENENEFVYMIYTVQADNKVNLYAYYKINGSTTHALTADAVLGNSGSEVAYPQNMTALNFGQDGMFSWHNGGYVNMCPPNFFKKCIMTLGSPSGISVSFSQINGAAAWVDASLSNVTLNAAYAKDTLFNAPAATLTKGANSVAATAILVGPDGSVVANSTPSQVGTYTLVYTATIGGKNYYAAKTVNVVASLDAFTASSANTTVTENAGSVVMDIAAGDSVTMNREISWEGLAANGSKLFELYTDQVESANLMSYYGDKEVVVTVTDAVTGDWISFRTYCYGGYQLTCAITTSGSYSGTWWMDRRNYSTYSYYINIYEGGIYNTYATANNNLSFTGNLNLPETFTSGIVTVSSTTGIKIRFSNLANDL